MSLLTVCKDVLAETGWPDLGTIVSNTDGTARQLLRICNTELETLSEALAWPHLDTDYEFDTVADQDAYTLPDDFRVLVQSSGFNADQYYALKGSVGTQEWLHRKYGLLGSLDRWTFRFTYSGAVPEIQFAPTPVDVQSLVIMYSSKEYARDEDGVSVPKYTADTDVAKIPEKYITLGAKWRFRRAKGLDFSVELKEYNEVVRTQFSKYKAQADIPVGGKRYGHDYPITQGYVPDTGFGV